MEEFLIDGQSGKIQEKWKNEPTFKDLSEDKTNATEALDISRGKILKWRLDRDGGKAIKARPGRSTIRPKTIRKQYEWKYPALEEPFLNTANMYQTDPNTEEDGLAAEMNGLLLNYQWREEIGKVKLIKGIARKVVSDGTVIVKTGWSAKYGTKLVEKEQPLYASPEESVQIMQQAVQSGEMTQERMVAMMEMGEPVQKGVEKVYVKEETLVENKPTHSIRNVMNIYIDPTCGGDITKAQFLIEDYDTSWAELKEKEYKEVESTNPETGEVTVIKSGIYHNLHMLYAEKLLQGESTLDEYETDERNSFEFSDKARKKIKATEYWGYWDIQGDGVLVPIVATWIGQVMIRMEENPFPHKRIPYSSAQYMTVVDEFHGEPDAEILAENQESIGKMTRAAHDITGTQAVGQEFIDENFLGPTQRNAYEKGNVVYYRSGFDPQTAIYRRKVENVDPTVFRIIEMQQKEAEDLSGTVPFGQGGQSGSVFGLKSAQDSTSKRELSILRNISDMLLDMARMVISMNQAYMPEEQMIRIANKTFTKIRRDDLSGKVDVSLEISTPEKDNETADKLMTLMQTNSASMDPGLAALHYEKIAKLWKMPDLADQIKNHKPQADPVQEQIQQLQLENARLENEKLKVEMIEANSRMAERASRTTENESDIRRKNAEALLKEETARKIGSEADEVDRKFVKEMSGEARNEKIDDEEFKDRQKQEERQYKHFSEMEKMSRTAGKNKGAIQ